MNRREILINGSCIGLALSQRSWAGTAKIADTASGRLSGTDLGGALEFKGIPYGADTSGKNRFQPPAPPRAWSGVRDATKFGQGSPQLRLDGQVSPKWLAFCTDVPGTPTGEDCLMLNLWTPALDARKRPVMVWLHGGGYTVGSASRASTEGANLAREHDVVVVTVNHRLNAFCYLDLEGAGAGAFTGGGNNGQLDIVAALQWVQQHAARFGGDPTRVLVFGESGGGGKVSNLLAMPAARGLFHRAAIQSGASVRSGSRENATKAAAMLLQELQLTPATALKLQDLPSSAITDAAKRVAAKGGGRGFAPVLDGKAIPTHPFDPRAAEVSLDVPVMVGYNHTESTLFQVEDEAAFHLDKAAFAARIRKLAGDSSDKVIAAYEAAYPAASPSDLYFIMSTDASMAGSSSLLAERKSAAGRAPAYLYRFDWQTPVDGGRMRAAHTVEIPFVFNTMNVPLVIDSFGNDPGNAVLAKKISGIWASFARTGKPEYAGIPQWQAYDAQRRATMVFDSDSRLVLDPQGEAQRMLRAAAGPGRSP